MKKFKNTLSIKGSEALLVAFVSELKKLGYKNDDISGEINWVGKTDFILINYDGINGNYGYHNHSGSNFNKINLNLPYDWDSALKLAAEVEIEISEYVEILVTEDCFKKGEILKTEKYSKDAWRFIWPDGSGQTYYNRHKDYFKPSTKAAYETQNIIKPEVGKWYKSINQSNILVYCKKLVNDSGIIGYGIDGNGDWYNDNSSWFGDNFSKHAVLATDEEVEERLIEYAKKHYPIGTRANQNTAYAGNGNTFIVKNTIINYYYDQSSRYWNLTVSSYGIFNSKDGKWAEILPNNVEIKGYTVIKIDYHTVKVGCKKFDIDDLRTIRKFLEEYGGYYNIDGKAWHLSDIQEVIDEFNKM